MMYDVLPERCRDYAEAYTRKTNILGVSLICIAFVVFYLIIRDLYWLVFAAIALVFLIVMLYDIRRVKKYFFMRLVLNEQSLDVRDIRNGENIQSIPYSEIKGVEVRQLRISDAPVRRRFNVISEQTLVFVHYGETDGFRDSDTNEYASNKDCWGIEDFFNDHCFVFAYDETALDSLMKHMRDQER